MLDSCFECEYFKINPRKRTQQHYIGYCDLGKHILYIDRMKAGICLRELPSVLKRYGKYVKTDEYVAEEIIIRWTTEANFNKGTHDSTVTVSIGDGAVQLESTLFITPFAHWHLNHLGANDEAIDSSGNNRHGTLFNMDISNWVAGKLNLCLRFDGVNEYVTFGNIADFEYDNAFSFECWFKTSSTAQQFLFTKNSNTGTLQGILTNISTTSGKIIFYLINNLGTGIYLKVDTVATGFNDGFFHHLVITYDGSHLASGCHIYIDDDDKALTVSHDNLSTNSIKNEIDFQISGANGSNVCWNGEIDEAVIYDFELTQEQVDFRWNGGAGREDMGTGDYASSGTYLSNSYDTKMSKQAFKQVNFNDKIPLDTDIQYYVRTSEDGLDWGNWSSPLQNWNLISKTGRFIQWKAELSTSDTSKTPILYDFSIIYLKEEAIIVSP